MASILYRFAALINVLPANAGKQINFTDASAISAWAVDGILFCQSTEIIQGVGGGRFSPRANATRAEAAAIITRFIKYVIR